MTDLIAFGLELQDSPKEDGETDNEFGPEWSGCADCERSACAVQRLGQHTVPLCPNHYTAREGLR